MNPIAKAVEIAGGQSAVARALTAAGTPITPQGVGHWCRAKTLPAERVLDLEALALAKAKGKERQQVTRHQLRPDLYPNHD